MKRFLMLVGVAVVAAAMYVAASPASQQSSASGPTLKQFNALKKQVAKLSKKLTAVKDEADVALGLIGACYLKDNGNNTFSFSVMPVSQRGGSTAGYQFDNGTTIVKTTALDEVASSPQAYLQTVDPQCATTSFLRRKAIRSGSSRVQHWVERNR